MLGNIGFGVGEDFFLDLEIELGFVPTMGALHQGHGELIKKSSEENDLTILSIFVNPTQFNDQADFEKYPITLEKDIAMLEAAGCDVLFLPAVKQIYPDGVHPQMNYELGYLETVLEGKFRPGHFQGVCTVVHRLLDIVLPHNLYLGQKDYQQCMVIRKLVALIKQEEKINVVVCPTLREADGLAMSSRNLRLGKNERETAAVIYHSLGLIQKKLQKGDTTAIVKEAHSILEKAGFKIDYVEIADARNLSLVTKWDGRQKITALIAAYLNHVRLIDNMTLN